MGRLDGKVAVITGGASGIGLATGKVFVDEGANVLLVDIREDTLKRAVCQIDGDMISYIRADVTDPDQTQQYVQAAIERYGRIDIFIANAGMIGATSPIVDYPLESFKKVLEVNVVGVWLGLKYVIPHMQQQGAGSIVITSSISGLRGFRAVSGYVASKHAVIGIMRSVAHEYASFGIRVNVVSPGAVDTNILIEGFCEDKIEERKRAIALTSPMRRLAEPEEVARLMLFLASDESSFCTGAVYPIDGGMSA